MASKKTSVAATVEEELSAFELLQISSETVNFVKLDDLKIDTDYRITQFQLIETKFGKRIAVLIDRDQIFLPNRFNKSSESMN